MTSAIVSVVDGRNECGNDEDEETQKMIERGLEERKGRRDGRDWAAVRMEAG